MALLGRFFGSTVSTGAGFAFGRASAPALSPAIEKIRQEAWETYPDRLPDAGVLAEGVSQGQVDAAEARAWAKKHGFDTTAFDALVAIANIGPGMAQAFNLWRRRQIDEVGFRRALKRLGLESEWIDALWNVRQDVLDPADLARGIHRGLVPDPGLLQGNLPSGVGNVPAYPVYPIDALREAEAAGLDHDHLGVLVGLQGNPMGAHEAANAVFRKILTPDDYLRAIAEGNTRNEWAEAIFEQSRQLPTAREFLENALRGYRTLAEALAGAELHGMTPEHATMVYQNQGRPLNVHQITQALARGAKFHPEPGEITDPYRASTVEGPLKPAYYEMNEALKYVVPGVFAIRALTESGVWSEAKAAERLKWAGWYPPDADEVAKAWATPSATTKQDPLIGKAESKLWTVMVKAYTEGGITKPQATTALDHLTTDPAVRAKVFEMLDAAIVVLNTPPPPAPVVP